jgi:hypothetical protein
VDTRTRTPRGPIYGIARFYIREGGSNANDGLSSTTAKADLPAAWAAAASQYDFRGANVVFDIGPGVFEQNGTFLSTYASLVGAPSIKIQGAGSNQTTALSNDDVALSLHEMPGISTFTIEGLHLISHGIGTIYANSSTAQCNISDLILDSQADAAGTYAHLILSDAKVAVLGNLTLRGNCSRGLLVELFSSLVFAGQSTLVVENNNFSYKFTEVRRHSAIYLEPSATISGSATGSRYLIAGESFIETYGRGQNALPGNAAGTVDTARGGFYA